MIVRRLAAAALALAPLCAAVADAPPSRPAAVTCSLKATACATRGADGRTVTVWRKGPGGTRRAAWTARTASPHVQVADDGRSLVELYPGLNLLGPEATAATPMLVFHRPAQPPVTVRLVDVAARPAALPRTVSHRQWARAFGYDGAGGFLLMLTDGRTLRYDPATGRPHE